MITNLQDTDRVRNSRVPKLKTNILVISLFLFRLESKLIYSFGMLIPKVLELKLSFSPIKKHLYRLLVIFWWKLSEWTSVKIKVYVRDTKHTVQFIDARSSSKDVKCFSSHYSVRRQTHTCINNTD